MWAVPPCNDAVAEPWRAARRGQPQGASGSAVGAMRSRKRGNLRAWPEAGNFLVPGSQRGTVPPESPPARLSFEASSVTCRR